MSHIVVWRPFPTRSSRVGYWHHGILCPDHSVIHYVRYNSSSLSSSRSSPPLSSSSSIILNSFLNFRSFRVQRTPLNYFIRHASPEMLRTQTPCYVVRHSNALPSSDVVHRATSRLGETGYNLLFNNCEHFARWCILGGTNQSTQSRQTTFATVALISGFVIGGPVGGIAATLGERYITGIREIHPNYVPLHLQYTLQLPYYPQPNDNRIQNSEEDNANLLADGHTQHDQLFYPQPSTSGRRGGQEAFMPP